MCFRLYNVHATDATDNTDNQILSRMLSLRFFFLFFRTEGIGIVLYRVGYIQFENKNEPQTFCMQWLTTISAIHICISEMGRVKCRFSFLAIHGFR